MYLPDSTVKADTLNNKELNALVNQANQGITSEENLAGALKFIRKSFYEKALNAKLDEHPGYNKHAASTANHSGNGYSSKTVYSDSSPLELNTPRERNGNFELQALKKRQIRLPLMDSKITYLYSKGLSA